ncbi:MAG: ATP-binding protein [Pseudomonadota bacterium]|nr:ATP-binding protein [Pseudomonadota bacterium]
MLDEKQLPLKIVVPVILVVAVVLGWYTHESTRTRLYEQQSQRTSEQLSLRANLLQRRLQEDRAKAHFLYSTPPVQGIVRATLNGGVDPEDDTRLAQWKRRLEIIFEAYLEDNPSVQQVRYIGLADDGRELVRVDRAGGNLKVRRGKELQAKGGRVYVQDIGKLKPDQIYVSEINLNREYGEIVFPHQPTYRIGVPVFDADYNIFGMIILNFDAQALLHSLTLDMPAELGLAVMNAQRKLIAHPMADYAFRHELEGEFSWESLYQTVASPVATLGLVRDNNTGRAFFYQESTVPLDQRVTDRYMVLAVLLAQTHVEQLLYEQSTRSLLVGGGIVGLLLLFLFIFQSNLNKNLRLINTQARFESIIEGSSDAIVAMDPAGNIQHWNTSAQDMLGYSARQVEGQPLCDVLGLGDQQAMLEQAIKTIAEGKYHEPVSLNLKKRNQSCLYATVSLSLIANQGTIMGISAIFRDVTAQIEAENKIREVNLNLELQVQERTRELEQARNEALSTSHTKSSFIANVSHEIRTPLNGIIGMLKLLRKANTPEQQQRYLAMAESSAGSLASLINDVLDLSKIEAGKLEIDNVSYDLERLISDMVVSMSVRGHEKDLELVVDTVNLQHPQVIGDPNRVRQVLTNLCSNALKFTHSGWIRVTVASTATEDHHCIISVDVEDTGIGIAESKLDSIFEAFSQEDSSVTREFGGTGLGLSITRQLCQMMGGDIEVSSTKGLGSVFHFTITQIVQEAAAAGPDDAVAPDLSGQRFLVVEPCKPVAASIANQLRHWHAERVDCVEALPEDWSSGSDYQLSLVDEKVMAAEHAATVSFPYALMIHHINSDPVQVASGDQCFKLVKPVTRFELLRLLKRVEGDESAEWQAASCRGGALPPEQTTGTPHSRSLDLKGVRILVVDDNPINQEVAVGLIEDSGAAISTVDNGQEAVDALAETPFDLVLMDCQMPVMDGYTATRQIRSGAAGEPAQKVPIVAMTASAMAGDRERCMLAGMDDYITKPLEPAELEPKLVYWINQIKRRHPIVAGGPIAKPRAADPTPVALAEFPLLDREALQRRVRHKPEREREMIAIFSEVSPARVEELDEAIRQGDAPRVAALAHALKGSAGSLGAVRVQQLCQTLEVTAQGPNPGSLLPYLEQLQQEFADLMAHLETLKATPGRDSSLG